MCIYLCWVFRLLPVDDGPYTILHNLVSSDKLNSLDVINIPVHTQLDSLILAESPWGRKWWLWKALTLSVLHTTHELQLLSTHCFDENQKSTMVSAPELKNVCFCSFY